MISEEHILNFDKLDINKKRNQISGELVIIHELIKKSEERIGLTPITKVKNYDTVKNSNLRESEILTFFYEDIYNIQQELITMLSAIDYK